jgi:hypothetical protein
MPKLRFPPVLTTGQAAKKAGRSIRTIHDWVVEHPEWIVLKLPTGILLDAEAFDKYLLTRPKNRHDRPPDPEPRTAREGEAANAPE